MNISWLQGASYAQLSRYDGDGLITWAATNIWAAGLSYGGYEDRPLVTFSVSAGNASGSGYNS